MDLMTKPMLILCAFILFLPNLLNISIFSESSYNHKEEYDPALSYINTEAKLNLHIDSILKKKAIANGTYQSVVEINNVIRKRFYHGYSHFTISENWIAAISGKLFDSGLACKVRSANILQHQNAACSQQAIVMMSSLRKRGILYRHISFPHHYALDVLVADKWYFFDPNLEPNMNRDQRSEDGWKYHSDSLKQYYDRRRMTDPDYVFGNALTAEKGSINEVPASHARLFQLVTGIFSKTVWCFPLLLIFLRSGKYFPFRKSA